MREKQWEVIAMQGILTVAQVEGPFLPNALRQRDAGPCAIFNGSGSIRFTRVEEAKKMWSIQSALVNMIAVIQCTARIALFLSIYIDAFS
jgi:hypothetical protein